MNRTPEEIIDALAFAVEHGGVDTMLIGDNEAARLAVSWRDGGGGLVAAAGSDAGGDRGCRGDYEREPYVGLG